jgi:hypothetical protein
MFHIFNYCYVCSYLYYVSWHSRKGPCWACWNSCARRPLTDEVSLSRSHVNLLANHMGLSWWNFLRLWFLKRFFFWHFIFVVLWCVWIPFDVRCTITPDTHTEAGLNCTTTSRLRCCSTVKIYNKFLIISKITRYQQKSTQWKFRTFKRLEVTLIRHQTIRNPTKKNKSKSKIIRFNKDIALISEFTLLVYWKIQKNQTHTKKNEINVLRLVTENKFHPQKIIKFSNAPKKMPVEKMNPKK